MVAFKSLSVVFLCGTIALSGCTNQDGTNNNTGTGVGIGAAVGALIGRAVSGDGDKAQGTAIGGIGSMS